MNCRDIESALSAYMDRELPVWEKTRVSDHLSRCSACQSELDALLQVKRLVRSQPMPELPGHVLHAIEQATSHKPASWMKRGLIRWWVPTLAFAAALSGWLLTRAADQYYSRTPELLVANPQKPPRLPGTQAIAHSGQSSPSRGIQ